VVPVKALLTLLRWSLKTLAAKPWVTASVKSKFVSVVQAQVVNPPSALFRLLVSK
jgi:hypothetical protein